MLSVSFGHGFPWGDTPETGSKVLVVADGDRRLAESVATEIGHAIYDRRETLLPRYPDIDAALDRAAGTQGVRRAGGYGGQCRRRCAERQRLTPQGHAAGPYGEAPLRLRSGTR